MGKLRPSASHVTDSETWTHGYKNKPAACCPAVQLCLAVNCNQNCSKLRWSRFSYVSIHHLKATFVTSSASEINSKQRKLGLWRELKWKLIRSKDMQLLTEIWTQKLMYSWMLNTGTCVETTSVFFLNSSWTFVSFPCILCYRIFQDLFHFSLETFQCAPFSE